MRNFRIHAAFFGVVFLSNTLFFSASAETGAPKGVDPKLVQKCNSGDGKSCAFIAALTFKTNERLARSYYKKACDFGYTSSCVFTGDTTVGDVKMPPLQKKPVNTSSEMENVKAEALLWYRRSFRYFLESTVLAVNEKKSAKQFTVDACERPHVALKEGEVPPPTIWKFSEGCDLQGTATSSKIENGFLNNSDFRVRNLEDAVRVVLKMESVQVAVVGKPEQKLVTIKIYDGVLSDENGADIAKFSATISYYTEWDKKKFLNVVSSPSGRAVISEFHGQKINLDTELNLHHLVVEGTFVH